MKRIAALTMVRNDEFYLRKWVEYYGSELGLDNIFVYFDGLDQTVPAFCEGIHAELVEKIGHNVREHDKGRVAFLSAKAAQLFLEGYDLVIGTDADEFIVVDPSVGMTLPEYLSAVRIKGSLSALGLDFGQKLGEEADIDASKPFLDQRHYAQIGTRYTKACILSEPLEWGSGFHRVKGHNFHIAPDLYLFHFGYFDMKRIQDRFSDKSRLEQGWEKHMKKRSRTIRLVSSLPARDFGKTTSFARCCQTMVRPPYAWNKPAMFELKLVVRIPERFSGII